jgi:hypothetical protein
LRKGFMTKTTEQNQACEGYDDSFQDDQYFG